MSAAPACVACGHPGIPILYGLPTPEAWQAHREGLIEVAGCFRPDEAPHWTCEQRHTWSTNEAQWDAALDRAVEGRPYCPVCGGHTRDLLYTLAEHYQRELADGRAEVATKPGPAGIHRARICRACRTVLPLSRMSKGVVRLIAEDPSVSLGPDQADRIQAWLGELVPTTTYHIRREPPVEITITGHIAWGLQPPILEQVEAVAECRFQVEATAH